tara:strand:- start:19 stop:156 length:138 start_codon:yes stop_codon:yes gene_type:complete
MIWFIFYVKIISINACQSYFELHVTRLRRGKLLLAANVLSKKREA